MIIKHKEAQLGDDIGSMVSLFLLRETVSWANTTLFCGVAGAVVVGITTGLKFKQTESKYIRAFTPLNVAKWLVPSFYAIFLTAAGLYSAYYDPSNDALVRHYGSYHLLPVGVLSILIHSNMHYRRFQGRQIADGPTLLICTFGQLIFLASYFAFRAVARGESIKPVIALGDVGAGLILGIQAFRLLFAVFIAINISGDKRSFLTRFNESYFRTDLRWACPMNLAKKES
eukprot:jgi/Bigna1/86296/estExt_fgenesh1_pg.C_90220